MDNENSKVSKEELAIKVIKIHEELDFAKNERRKMKKDFDRKIKEVKVLALGNKRDIKNIYRRTEDNLIYIEKLQDYIQWVIKTILGLLLTIGITFILNSFFKIF